MTKNMRKKVPTEVKVGFFGVGAMIASVGQVDYGMEEFFIYFGVKDIAITKPVICIGLLSTLYIRTKTRFPALWKQFSQEAEKKDLTKLQKVLAGGVGVFGAISGFTNSVQSYVGGVALLYFIYIHNQYTDDKANVLATSVLWREIITEISQQYPEVTVTNMLVDNCAMQLVLNPSQFDVILTSNLFGDILSDLGAALSGSIGLIPSASLNKENFGLYEPSGGSAPDIAGKNLANPIAQILSAAMLLHYSFHLYEEALCIENGILKLLSAGICTKDIAGKIGKYVSTSEFVDQLLRESVC